MNPNYPFVAQRAKHRCEYCHAPEIIFKVAFEVEHIIPLSKKGLDEQQNWALACRVCNLRKLERVDGVDPVISCPLASRVLLSRRLYFRNAINRVFDNPDTPGHDISQQQVRLFNPRIDVWEEHISVQSQPSFQIEGRTPIGRGTVERLEMNSPLQLRARELWIALGIF